MGPSKAEADRLLSDTFLTGPSSFLYASAQVYTCGFGERQHQMKGRSAGGKVDLTPAA